MRSPHFPVALAITALYAASCSPSPTPDDVTAFVIEDSPLHGRYGHSVVWTGSEMIAWGGQAGTDFKDGAAYDPEADAWRPIAAPDLPARHGHSAVWTGEEMVVSQGRSSQRPHIDGAAYDPEAGTWRSIADAPISAGAADAFMVGGHMVTVSKDAILLYDLQNDEWTQIDPGFEAVDGARLSTEQVVIVGTGGNGGIRVGAIGTEEGAMQPLVTRGIAEGPWTNLGLAPSDAGELRVLAADADATTSVYRNKENEWSLELTDTSGYLVPASGTGTHATGPAFNRWDSDRLLSLNNASVGIYYPGEKTTDYLQVKRDRGLCLSSRYTVLTIS